MGWGGGWGAGDVVRYNEILEATLYASISRLLSLSPSRLSHSWLRHSLEN